MTPQQYLEGLLERYNLTEGQIANLKAQRAYVQELLKAYFGTGIETVYYSGSYAKGTAINLSFDLDICLYFQRNSFAKLQEMYVTVLEALQKEGLDVDPQTVSIHVNLGGSDIDVVPARSFSDGTGNANLYVTTRDSSIQTNIPIHKEYMSKHQARPVIKLMKVWRHRHGIHFKSFALELLVIKALEGSPATTPIDRQFMTTLTFAADQTTKARLVDPANTNNVVSDLIPENDKANLQAQAAASLKQPTWDKIVW